jgi:hypothetical protein
MGEIQNQPFQLSFIASLQVDFQPACRRQGFPRHFRPACGRQAVAGAAAEDRQLVLDQLAAEAGEDGRSADETCPLLLATAGREPSDAAVVYGDGAKDCRLAGGDGVDGGGGCSENQTPGQ